MDMVMLRLCRHPRNDALQRCAQICMCLLVCSSARLEHWSPPRRRLAPLPAWRGAVQGPCAQLDVQIPARPAGRGVPSGAPVA
eukprot:5067442-Pyramimonas_sp.AAC.1